MKRALILLSALLLLLPGCRQERSGRVVTVYSPSDEVSGSALEAEELPDLSEDDADKVEYLLFLLTEGMDEMGYESPLPQGTVVNSWTLEDGMLTVDFSSAYGQLSGLDLILADYCVTLTMSGLDAVDTVTITVEGHLLAEHRADGLTAEDITLDGGVSDPVTLEIQLFFPLVSGEDIGTEYRALTADSEAPADQVEAVLEALCAGPSSSTMRGFLPADSQELAVQVEGGICTLALEKDSLEMLLSDTLALTALESTITELEMVDSILLCQRMEG